MLSGFLFFGKEGAVRGRTFQNQVNTFSWWLLGSYWVPG